MPSTAGATMPLAISVTTPTVKVMCPHWRDRKRPAGSAQPPGDGIANIYWTAPGSLDGGTLTGYTATATPSGAACTTTGATSCTITGLSNGTAYQVSVVAHTTAGDSGASPAAGVTPGSGLAFTSNPADTASFGVPFSFTVTTTGSPSPKITKAGKLPPGVGFTDNRNGTATISGTPTGSAAGIYPLTLIAKNKTATATATFALTVTSTRAPSINKIPATKATVGTALTPGHYEKGIPLAGLDEFGPLPHGLNFSDNGNGTAAITGTPSAQAAEASIRSP